mmetsp:Transcript_4768/g.14149  ORF Transcript_4768/g.14149 Transcript_4768/m.14149 type:complete len:215 (+) Transcript_4768:489-1133(+)
MGEFLLDEPFQACEAALALHSRFLLGPGGRCGLALTRRGRLVLPLPFFLDHLLQVKLHAGALPRVGAGEPADVAAADSRVVVAVVELNGVGVLLAPAAGGASDGAGEELDALAELGLDVVSLLEFFGKWCAELAVIQGEDLDEVFRTCRGLAGDASGSGAGHGLDLPRHSALGLLVHAGPVRTGLERGKPIFIVASSSRGLVQLRRLDLWERGH